MPTRLLTLLAALFAMTLLGAACSGAETDDDASPSPTATATDDASPTPTATATDEATEEPTDGATTPAATDAPTDPAETEVADAEPPADAPATEAPATQAPADGGDPPADTGGGGQQPTTAFPPVPAGQDDPCMLSTAQMQQITGTALALLGPTGTPEYQICSYGEPSDPFSVDLMLVNLQAASETAGETIDGELYISDLREAAGDGEVQDLDALGDGSAILVSDTFGTTAWAHAGNHVYGATSSGLDDDAGNAQALLQTILDSAGS